MIQEVNAKPFLSGFQMFVAFSSSIAGAKGKLTTRASTARNATMLYVCEE
jgi:hypothetical protein